MSRDDRTGSERTDSESDARKACRERGILLNEVVNERERARKFISDVGKRGRKNLRER